MIVTPAMKPPALILYAFFNGHEIGSLLSQVRRCRDLFRLVRLVGFVLRHVWLVRRIVFIGLVVIEGSFSRLGPRLDRDDLTVRTKRFLPRVTKPSGTTPDAAR